MEKHFNKRFTKIKRFLQLFVSLTDFMCLFLAVWVFLVAHRLSLAAASGGHSGGVWGAHCGGLLLQGDQASNLCVPHWWEDASPLSHQRSPTVVHFLTLWTYRYIYDDPTLGRNKSALIFKSEVAQPHGL